MFRVAGELNEIGLVYCIEFDHNGYGAIYIVWSRNLFYSGETLARLRRLIKERTEYYSKNYKMTSYYDL